MLKEVAVNIVNLRFALPSSATQSLFVQSAELFWQKLYFLSMQSSLQMADIPQKSQERKKKKHLGTSHFLSAGPCPKHPTLKNM